MDNEAKKIEALVREDYGHLALQLLIAEIIHKTQGNHSAHPQDRFERAKRDSNQIFGVRYEEIFNEDYSIEYLRDIYLLYQKIDVLKEQEKTDGKRGVLTNSERFLTYGMYHILYLVGILADRKNMDISNVKNRDALINDALEIMRKYLKIKNTSNYYNLFRNPRTKDELYDIALDKGQLEFQLELVNTVAV